MCSETASSATWKPARSVVRRRRRSAGSWGHARPSGARSMAVGFHCRRATTREKKLGQKLRLAGVAPADHWSFFGPPSPSVRGTGLPSSLIIVLGRTRTGDVVEPLAVRHVVARALAGLDLPPELSEQAVAFGHHVVRVDRLEVLLARGDKGVDAEPAEAIDRHADHLPHAVLHEAGAEMGLLHDLHLVRALHQLVDLRAHRCLDDLEQGLGIELVEAAPRTADMERPDAALVVGRDGHGLEHARDLVVAKAVLPQPLPRAVHHELLGAGAGGHPLGLHSDESPRSSRRRYCRSEQRVDLLGCQAGHGGSFVLRVARRNRDLGAPPVLAVAYALSYVRGERLRLESGFAEDDLVDRLVHDLFEARHMRPLLLRAEVDQAFELCIKQLLGPVRANADDFLDTGDAHAREAQVGRRPARLDVAPEKRASLDHGDQRYRAGALQLRCGPAA